MNLGNQTEKLIVRYIVRNNRESICEFINQVRELDETIEILLEIIYYGENVI